MGEELDVDALKRRGRRRLIGAIALVLLAVLMLPMVFDPEPGPATSSVQVRIPGEGDANFSPKGESARTASVTPTGKAEVSDDSPRSAGAANTLSGAVAASVPSVPSVPASSVAVPPPVATPSAAPPAAVSALAGDAKDKSSSAVTGSKLPQNAKSAPVAAASGLKREVPASAEKSGFVVQIAAFSSSQKLKELVAKLKAENISYFIEPVATAKGQVTRVRAGPFETKESADKVRERLVRLGLKPRPSVQREG